MARVTAVYKPCDYPGNPDDATKGDVAALFGYLFPNVANPEIDKPHSGMAIAALNPKLALNLAKMSRFIALDAPWCQRNDLRELVVQNVNLQFKCDFSFQARLPQARAAGLSIELLAALPYWKTSQLFDAEQRLAIEYTNAVISGDVPAELFNRVVAEYGEKGAVEFTTAIAWWSFWAMLLNATRPEFD